MTPSPRATKTCGRRRSRVLHPLDRIQCPCPLPNFGREAWLFWNLGLNKLGEKFEGLLPPKVAGLEGNGVG